jgi:hypothetical protein
MDTYDPAELIALCERIIEDGELSYDEIYGLAEWLNAHQEACFNWPGNVLVGPLQEAWKDAKITKTEARQLARLIQKICKEWGKKQAEQAFAQAAEIALAAVQVLDLTQPRLPIIPFVSRIKSHSEKGKVYEVNLAGPTCTCPDWRNFRHRHPEQHLTRCCKHVFDAFSQFQPPLKWPGWLRSFFELAWTPHPQQQWVVLYVDHDLVLISNAPNGWANIFASDCGPYERYGYSVIERRWSYGIAPPNDRRIEKAVLAFAVHQL